MEKKKAQNNGSLKRQLNPMNVWAIAFGCVIGWGSFINPGKKFLSNSGVAGTAIAMILGALVMVIIAFSYAYMVPKYPKAGGEFLYGRNAPSINYPDPFRVFEYHWCSKGSNCTNNSFVSSHCMRIYTFFSCIS